MQTVKLSIVVYSRTVKGCQVRRRGIIEVMVAVLLIVVAVIDIMVLLKLRYVFKKLRFPLEDSLQGDDLPSVTICITARNETHAMTQCLERVVASDYPKLEVIVLDDGSRDDTSILIKSFAHSGVRFIEGATLPGGWLGKNYAQSILAREASGTFVFFLDVDTLIGTSTVTKAVAYAMHHQARMVSFIPVRNDQWHTSTIFATMRYFWTVIRFHPSRPRAAANAWLIDRELLLERFNSDASLPLSMEVETSIARYLAPDQAYRLVVSDTWLGLRYEKRWSSQVETSIRLLYPQCRKQWLQVLWLVFLLVLVLLPYVVAFFMPLALIIVALQYVMAYYYLGKIWVRFRAVGALVLPVILLQEITLLLTSAYKYNFGTITWKGRPIMTERRTP